MTTLVLPTGRITDWPSFHAECARLFGFPGFYGANLNAWIDCLSGLGDDDGMTAIRLQPGQPLSLRVPGFEAFSTDHPEVCAGFLGAVAFVNKRYIEAGESYRIVLILE